MRTLATAIGGRVWDGLWIYFTAPPLGMLVSAQLYSSWHGEELVFCAKLRHANGKRCSFRCNYAQLAPPPTQRKRAASGHPRFEVNIIGTRARSTLLDRLVPSGKIPILLPRDYMLRDNKVWRGKGKDAAIYRSLRKSRGKDIRQTSRLYAANF